MPSIRVVLALRLAPLAALVTGCGATDRAAPEPSNMVIAKPEGISGDQQVGVAGKRLADSLRVLVTHGGEPLEGVRVIWWTSEGSVEPTSAITDAGGLAATTWTTLPIFAQQFALARIDGEGGPTARFTAIVTPDPDAPTTIHVLSDGNRFEPAELTIPEDGTVYWYWPVEGSAHNIVPDDGESPPPSGAPAPWPKWHSFRFTIPGAYHYHCSAHGGPGGVGMSGTITVQPRVSD